MSVVLLFQDQEPVAPPTPPPPAGLSIEVIINSVARYPLFGWEITDVLNAQSSCRFTIFSEDAAYRPVIDHEVYVYQDSVLMFGGVITDIREYGVGNEPIVPIAFDVTAHDFERFAFRRQDVNETIPAGTLKAALQQLMPYAPGLTLDATQVDGPMLNELDYADAALDDIWNDLGLLTGYARRVSFDKKVRMFPPSSEAAPFNISVASDPTEGDLTVEMIPMRYANRVVARATTSTTTLRSVANDAAEQASKGYVQSIVVQADAVDQVGLDAVALAQLEKAKQTTRRVRYTTKTPGLRPGQTQTIVFPRRNLNGTFLITEVRMVHNEKISWFHVTCIEGTRPQDDFRVDYRKWSKEKTTGGATQSGGGGVTIYPTHVLAASGSEAVRSDSGPDWVPATGSSQTPGQGAVHVQIDTDESGTTLATVTARMRTLEAGTSVQARLWDVSASAAIPGISAPVSTQTFTTVEWEVTLNAGAHLYELQLRPDIVAKDVIGTGWVKQHD